MQGFCELVSNPHVDTNTAADDHTLNTLLTSYQTTTLTQIRPPAKSRRLLTKEIYPWIHGPVFSWHEMTRRLRTVILLSYKEHRNHVRRKDKTRRGSRFIKR